MQRAEPSGVTAEINVTPLVDVVLVLLIIFMVVTPILHSGAEIDLPVTEQPPERPDRERRILVSIERHGAIRIDGSEVSGDRFQQRMRELAEQQEGREVVIEGDARARFVQIKNAMLAVRAAGFNHVGLIAERRDPS